MISRHWKGIVKRQYANRYMDHLKTETFPQLAALPGFIQASVLRRDATEGTEFQVVTLWQSLKAIEAFAGGDVEGAVVPSVVQSLMVTYEHRVVHYEVVHTVLPLASPACARE